MVKLLTNASRVFVTSSPFSFSFFPLSLSSLTEIIKFDGEWLDDFEVRLNDGHSVEKEKRMIYSRTMYLWRSVAEVGTRLTDEYALREQWGRPKINGIVLTSNSHGGWCLLAR